MSNHDSHESASSNEGQPDRHLHKPFAGWSKDRLMTHVAGFIQKSGLEDYEPHFVRGALLAQRKTAFDATRKDGLTLDDRTRKAIDLENSKRRIDLFKQPAKLYALVACCSLGAAVQGWDQTAVNGAQIYFQNALGIQGGGLLGLVNGAPYLCCALACCLNYPLNKWLNRRGVIFGTCLISSITCLLQAFSQNWWQLFIFRFLLGFGIGPKSATIPIYAAEAAPENIRGALVMMWQMWTAFGIMFGYIFGVAFAGVGDRLSSMTCKNANEIINIFNDPQAIIRNKDSGSYVGDLSIWEVIAQYEISNNTLAGYSIPGNTTLRDTAQRILTSKPCSWNWRLMLASPMVLPLVVVAYVYTLPESPRVLLRNARKAPKEKAAELYEKAFLSLLELRNSKVQAARDLFLIDHLLLEEENIAGRKRFSELFTNGRCRRALIASVITMFLQQFCGVNVTAYYSSKIMRDDAGWGDQDALLLSMGFGIINFLFAFPAVWTIDSFGRRNLLLFTFPFMALFQIFNAIAFALPKRSTAQQALAITGMYLFGIAYSPGEGPVPFVYSAESMPLYNRDYGMGIVTAINWLLNFFVSMTWPVISGLHAMKTYGAFAWYAAWCVIGWWMILLFVPETKDLTLEQLDQVFERPTRDYIKHGLDQLGWFLRYKDIERPVFLPPPEAEYDERGDVGQVVNGIRMEDIH